MYRRLIVLLIAFALLLPLLSPDSSLAFSPAPAGQASAQEDDPSPPAPYLMFYSNLLNSFVIERADGADSRLFAPDQMPPATNRVGGPGWSPSGEWFAWTSSPNVLSDPAIASRPHVMAVDGVSSLDVLDFLDDAHLRWAPAADVLLVSGAYAEDYARLLEEGPASQAPPPSVWVGVIDAESGEASILYDQQIPAAQYLPLINDYPPRIWWSADGRYAYAAFPLGQGAENVETFVAGMEILVHDLDNGQTLTRTLPDITFDIVHDTGITPAGALSFRDGDGAYIHYDLVSDTRLTFSQPDLTLTQFIPNRAGTQALLIAQNRQAWLADLLTGETTAIAQNVGTTSFGDQTGMYWAPGDTDILMPQVDGNLAHYDLAAGQLHQYPIAVADWYGQGPSPWQYRDGRQVVVYSQPDDTGQVSAHLIDLAAASQVEAYPFALQSANIPRPAPDGLHLAVIDESIRVIDVVQDQSVSVGPDGRSRLSQSWGQVRWPDAPDWLILIESDGRALGGDHLWTGVMRADGEVRRRLGDCYSGTFCAVWLPARVDTTRLPAGQPASVLPEPETTIRTGHWTDELAYRPDGGQLAYLRSLPDSSQAEVIDAFSGEVLATLEDDPNRDLTWQDGRPLLAVDEREPGVLALSPAGQFRVVIPDTGYPEVQSTATGQRLLELPDYAGSQIIRFTPDSRYLLISQFSGTPVRIYSTATWELVATLNTNAQAMDVAPDGQTLAISTGWAIELYELSALLGG